MMILKKGIITFTVYSNADKFKTQLKDNGFEFETENVLCRFWGTEFTLKKPTPKRFELFKSILKNLNYPIY